MASSKNVRSRQYGIWRVRSSHISSVNLQFKYLIPGALDDTMTMTGNHDSDQGSKHNDDDFGNTMILCNTYKILINNYIHRQI